MGDVKKIFKKSMLPKIQKRRLDKRRHAPFHAMPCHAPVPVPVSYRDMPSATPRHAVLFVLGLRCVVYKKTGGMKTSLWFRSECVMMCDVCNAMLCCAVRCCAGGCYARNAEGEEGKHAEERWECGISTPRSDSLLYSALFCIQYFFFGVNFSPVSVEVFSSHAP